MAPLAGLPADLAHHPKFTIIRTLGQGGMGTVYQAEHRIMERLVAIKVINPGLVDHPEALQRFFSEVRSAARLQHPNIVAAYDAEQAGSLYLLVMEYVEGVNLAKYVEPEGPLPVEHACNFVRQAALGLQHAFEQGMVHRDIKPQNLMLTRKGQVKVLDFGLARLASERSKGKGLTQSGAFLGTPEYVAPEQAKDASTADIRADIYSLGCTLYFLLTGRPPFEEDTAVKLVLAHLEQEPKSLKELRPEAPAEVSNILARMLAKQPAERFQTPAEVVQALTPFARPGQKIITKVPAALTSTASPGQQTVLPADTSRMPRRRETVVQDSKSMLREVAKAATQKPKKARAARRRPPAKTWIAAGIAFLALLVAGGVVIRVATNKGTIKLELSDPKADVKIDVDGDTVNLTGLDEPLRLKVGDHELTVTGKNFETITRSFTVKRGDNPVLHITLPDNKRAENRVQPGQRSAAPQADGPPPAPAQNAGEDMSPARDRWVSIMPTEQQVANSDFAEYQGGLLKFTRDDKEGVAFGASREKLAKNCVLRAVAKRPFEKGTLILNLRTTARGQYHTYFYGGRTFGVGKHVHDENHNGFVLIKQVETTETYDDFFEYVFRAEDDWLTVEANGKQIIRVQDSTHNVAGSSSFGCYNGKGVYKSAEIKILDDAPKPPTNPPASTQKPESETGPPRNRWITLEPAKAQIYGNGTGRVENGVLVLDPGRGQGTSVGWNDLKIHPKNVTIRAKVRVPVGSENVAFTLREDPVEWRKSYALGFGRSDKPGRYDFNIAKHYLDGDQHRWTHLKTVEGLDVGLDVDDYFGISCSAIGDMLSISVNGKRVLEVRDSSYTEGVVGLASWESKAYFKDIEVKIHDDAAPPNVERNQNDGPQANASPPSPAAPRPQLAIGRWERLPAATFGLWDKDRAKVENGLIELHNTGATVPSVRARDIVFRAKVKRQNGSGQLQLSIRGDRGGCYSAWYDGKKFGITRWTQEGQKWDVLRDCPAPQVHRDFFQLSIAAVGDTLTLKVDGKPLLQARDTNFASGDISIGAWNGCRASFKDFEVLIQKE